MHDPSDDSNSNGPVKDAPFQNQLFGNSSLGVVVCPVAQRLAKRHLLLRQTRRRYLVGPVLFLFAAITCGCVVYASIRSYATKRTWSEPTTAVRAGVETDTESQASETPLQSMSVGIEAIKELADAFATIESQETESQETEATGFGASSEGDPTPHIMYYSGPPETEVDTAQFLRKIHAVDPKTAADGLEGEVLGGDKNDERAPGGIQ